MCAYSLCVANFVVANSSIKNMQVYDLNTLKSRPRLYGHSLPVLCMDISSDGDLLVSGSADKNIRIWGLDFGDCHKSLFAHADRYFSSIEYFIILKPIY